MQLALSSKRPLVSSGTFLSCCITRPAHTRYNLARACKLLLTSVSRKQFLVSHSHLHWTLETLTGLPAQALLNQTSCFAPLQPPWLHVHCSESATCVLLYMMAKQHHSRMACNGRLSKCSCIRFIVYPWPGKCVRHVDAVVEQ